MLIFATAMTEFLKKWVAKKREIERLKKITSQLVKFKVGQNHKSVDMVKLEMAQAPYILIRSFLKNILDINKLDTGIIPSVDVDEKVARQFMQAYLYYYFPEEAKAQSNQCSDEFLHYSKTMLNTFHQMIYQNEVNYKMVNLFCALFTLYLDQLKKQINTSVNQQIEELAQMFWLSCAQIYHNIYVGKERLIELEAVKKNGKMEMDGENIDVHIAKVTKLLKSAEKQYDDGFVHIKAKVIEQVKQIGGECGLKYFESIVPVFMDGSVLIEIQTLMKKAYWDKMYDDLEKSDFSSLLRLLEELKYYMMSCVPNRHDIHKEIHESIDIELWRQMLEHNAYNKKDVIGTIEYIYLNLVSWCLKDKMLDINNERKKFTALILKENVDLKKLIVVFLENVFAHLENILEETNSFKTSNEYHRLKESFQYKLANN